MVLKRVAGPVVVVACCLSLLAGCADQQAEVAAKSAPPGSVSVPTYALTNFFVAGGGYDQDGYWLVYRHYRTGAQYSMVVGVRGGLPDDLPWYLPRLPRPSTPEIERRTKVYVVGSIADNDRRTLANAITRTSRNGFFTFAGDRQIQTVDERRFIGDREIPVSAYLRGSLSNLIFYTVRFGGPTVGAPFGFLSDGRSYCAGDTSTSTIAYFPRPGTHVVRVASDLHTVAAGRPARDPVERRQTAFAFSVPASTTDLDVFEDGRFVSRIDVPACVFN